MPYCLICLYGLVVSSLLVSCSSAVNCPNGLHYFPPDSCVSLSPGQSRECDFGTTAGLAVLSESQLSPGGILSSYAAAVLEGSQLMWLGYSYNSGGDVIQDGQGLTGRVIGSVLNYNDSFDLSTSVNPGSGICIAVNRNGAFVRKRCSDNLQWSLCQRRYRAAPNVSVSGPSSPITEGSSVTLTCENRVHRANAAVSWLAAIGSDPPAALPSTYFKYTISNFSQSTHSGLYFCVSTNPLGAYVSTPVLLNSTGLIYADAISPTFQTDPAPVVYNAAANFSCSFNLGSDTLTRVLWFINGSPASSSGLVLSVDSVQQQGFYKCLGFTTGGLIDGTERIMPKPGVPGVVDVVSVEPMSKSSLSVQWLCPEGVGTHDPVLLTYQVTYYSSSSSSSTPSVVSVRAANTMQDKNSCLLRTVLEGLEEGTSYSVKVQAMAGSVPGEVPSITAQASTFGRAPGAVNNFMVFRTEDKKTVQAKWDKVETTPPMGVVSEYHIEYRQYNKKSVSSIKNTADQTTVVIANVIDFDSYELRVRAGVWSTRDPPTISYGPFTEWKRVGGTIPVTPAPLSPERDVAGIIAAGVIVGGLVFIIILSLFVVGTACVIIKARRGELASFYKGDHSHLQEVTDGDEDGP